MIETVKIKYLRVSPKKLRKVAGIVNNLGVNEAMFLLQSIPNKGAKYILKGIKSAVANIKFKEGEVDEELMTVKQVLVEDGPRMKRLLPRARGRADIILRRFSHLKILVEVKEK